MTISSDFNLQKINTKELADNLLSTINFGGNILIVARRGSGKTSISKDMISRSKCKEIYLNLSLMERPDIGGYPNFFGAKNGEKFINFLMPSLFKDLMEGDTPCVALLDEVDKADNSLLAPLLEFIQFRTINGTPLKNLKATIMTGNLQSEGGQRPPLPLLDRTEKFLVEIDPRHWLDWAAISKEIHPSIAAYISDNLGDLCGPVEQAEAYADESPRGWHNASKLVMYGEQHKWHPTMIVHKVGACVGKRAGLKYSAFFEHYQILLPVVDKIIKGEKTPEFSQFENTKKLVVCMILCSRVSKLLDDAKEKYSDKEELLQKTQNIHKYVTQFLTSVDPEISLICMRSQIGMQRFIDFGLLDNKYWDPLISSLLQKLK